VKESDFGLITDIKKFTSCIVEVLHTLSKLVSPLPFYIYIHYLAQASRVFHNPRGGLPLSSCACQGLESGGFLQIQYFFATCKPIPTDCTRLGVLVFSPCPASLALNSILPVPVFLISTCRLCSMWLLAMGLWLDAAAQIRPDGYTPLRASGTIPQEFLSPASVRAQQRGAEVSTEQARSNARDRRSREEFILASTFGIDQMLVGGLVMFNETRLVLM
jgi:hypothetical protein